MRTIPQLIVFQNCLRRIAFDLPMSWSPSNLSVTVSLVVRRVASTCSIVNLALVLPPLLLVISLSPSVCLLSQSLDESIARQESYRQGN